MPAKDVRGIRRRFLWDVHKAHVRFFHFSSAFMVIAGGAGRHHVCPDMLAAEMPRENVIHRQIAVAPAAILTGIIVTAEYFAARQLDAGPRPMDLAFQADDRRARDQLRDRADVAASIHDHVGFACQKQADGPSCGANMDWLEIRIEHEYRLLHFASQSA